jgi:hypothetical protein
VLLICSGDLNPLDANSAWFTLSFNRDGTLLSQQIDESHGNSWNIPFCMAYLDTVGAGTHTYTAQFTRGTGYFTLSEGGAAQAPNFVAIEI